MEKIIVIYWSQTGNTEAMAAAIANGMRAGGADVEVCNVSAVDADGMKAYDKIALGCPSMGAEVLEESEFEPFFTRFEKDITGKKVALFGSYDWGDGEWMRDWEKRVTDDGATLFESGKIVNLTPDDAATLECFEFGKRFSTLT